MKKVLITLLLAALLPLLAAAQIRTYLSVGIGMSTFSSDLEDLTLVPSVGIMLKAYEHNGLSVTPAALYQQRAQRTDIGSGDAITLRIHALNIEVPIQYRAGSGVSVHAGYFHAIGLHSGTVVKLGSEKTSEKRYLGDDVGAMAGLGYDAQRWAFRATYKHGLSDLKDGLKSRSFYLQFLYSIGAE